MRSLRASSKLPARIDLSQETIAAASKLRLQIDPKGQNQPDGGGILLYGGLVSVLVYELVDWALAGG